MAASPSGLDSVWGLVLKLFYRELVPGEKVEVLLPPLRYPERTEVVWTVNGIPLATVPFELSPSGLWRKVRFHAQPGRMVAGRHEFVVRTNGRPLRVVGGFDVRPFYFGF